MIDSKVSLAGYLRAHEEGADDECARAGMADHARQVRTTSRRSVRRRTGASCQATPEFVVMFLHDESSWLAALDVDPSLHEQALSNNVIPASPTNLIGLLRAVHYGWQQETIAEGARQISDLGRELYKRLSTMGAHVSKLGRSLDGAVKSYNETVGSLERQVLPQARRFEQHGITGHRAARARADRPPDEGAERPGARSVTPRKARSRSRSARPTPALPRLACAESGQRAGERAGRGFSLSPGFRRLPAQEHAAPPIRLLP